MIGSRDRSRAAVEKQLTGTLDAHTVGSIHRQATSVNHHITIAVDAVLLTGSIYSTAVHIHRCLRLDTDIALSGELATSAGDRALRISTFAGLALCKNLSAGNQQRIIRTQCIADIGRGSDIGT